MFVPVWAAPRLTDPTDLSLTDIASTSPSNASGFMPSSFTSVNSAITDYEVEVVEIRVKEGELKDIIP